MYFICQFISPSSEIFWSTPPPKASTSIPWYMYCPVSDIYSVWSRHPDCHLAVAASGVYADWLFGRWPQQMSHICYVINVLCIYDTGPWLVCCELVGMRICWIIIGVVLRAGLTAPTVYMFDLCGMNFSRVEPVLATTWLTPTYLYPTLLNPTSLARTSRHYGHCTVPWLCYMFAMAYTLHISRTQYPICWLSF